MNNEFDRARYDRSKSHIREVVASIGHYNYDQSLAESALNEASTSEIIPTDVALMKKCTTCKTPLTFKRHNPKFPSMGSKCCDIDYGIWPLAYSMDELGQVVKWTTFSGYEIDNRWNRMAYFIDNPYDCPGCNTKTLITMIQTLISVTICTNECCTYSDRMMSG